LVVLGGLDKGVVYSHVVVYKVLTLQIFQNVSVTKTISERVFSRVISLQRLSSGRAEQVGKSVTENNK
jgi:hypothetical protein